MSARECVLVLLLFVGGCLEPSPVVQCADGRICPGGFVCVDSLSLCVPADRLALCEGKAERAPCVLAGNVAGACHAGACFEAVCGNGLEDISEDAECLPELSECPIERCDDGNTTDGDGCSSNCRSDETCGNALFDSFTGEQCDDGNLVDHDGCSSHCLTEELRWVRANAPGPLSQARGAYDVARGKVVIVAGRVPGATTTTDPPTNAVSEYGDGVWNSFIATDVAPQAPPITTSDSDPEPLFALAYDVERRLTVMAGGASASPLKEVWGWDGRSWTRLPDLPFGLEGVAMAYDARRKRLVIFGGRTRQGSDVVLRDDTYELGVDDPQWTKVSVVTKPPPRAQSSLAYDPKRGVMVLYGGGESSTADTLWEYDGTTWVQKIFTGTGILPSQQSPSMAFDSTSGKLVLLNDTDSNGAKMMFWDGAIAVDFIGTMPIATPTLDSGPGTPTAVRYSAVFVEAGDGRIMLYGGQTYFQSTGAKTYLLNNRLHWMFGSQSWTEVVAPPPVFGACYAMQADRGAAMRFGGNPSTGSTAATSDLWELTRRGWVKFSSGPPALEFCAMAADAAHDQVLLFGGETNNGSVQMATNETWTRTGTSWTPHPPTAMWPQPRVLHGLAYDAARGETVLFGGRASNANSSTRYADTWVWNGTTWARRTPAVSPTGRSSFAMAYDPVGRVVVMFGGTPGQNQATNETWIWDGTTWTDLTPTLVDLPGQQDLVTLTWNPARQSLIMAFEFSFSLSTSDAWEWKMTSAAPYRGRWQRVSSSVRPPARFFPGAFASIDGAGVMVMNGLSSTTLDDMWQLRADATGSDTCQTAFDVDGDTLVMCADPDCWRVCAPECPPGTSCTQTGTRCGDSTCSALENCRNCPGDCATCSDTRCGDFVCDPGETMCPGDCP